MTVRYKKDKSEELFQKIDYGIRRGAACALAEHKRLGKNIVISVKGKIVYIPPEKIKIPKEFRDIVKEIN